jgi:hypothetical protein
MARHKLSLTVCRERRREVVTATHIHPSSHRIRANAEIASNSFLHLNDSKLFSRYGSGTTIHSPAPVKPLGNCQLSTETMASQSSTRADVKGITHVPRANSILDVNQGTCAGSLGRRLMVDMRVIVSVEYITKSADILPKGFLADLAIALRADHRPNNPDLSTMANKSRHMKE